MEAPRIYLKCSRESPII